jgi:hypothetical protein
MDFALQPNTTPGSRFVELAETHAGDFAVRGGRHDREGSFPFENIEDMQRSGVVRACVPLELAASASNLFIMPRLGSIGWAAEMARQQLASRCISFLTG